MEKVYRSRAPVRITFGGGGTDISPYDKKFGGLCVGAAINHYVYCSLKLRKDPSIQITSWDLDESRCFPNCNDIKYNGEVDLLKAAIKKMNPKFGFELYVRSDVSPHSGLGCSSAACVATIGLFNHLRKEDRLTTNQVAELAFKVEEEELENLGGRQDQYASAFGGLNLFEFRGDNFVLVNPLKARGDHLLELEKNLLIVNTGKRTKSSGQVHKEEKEMKLLEDRVKLGRLDRIKGIATEMEYCLREGYLDRFGELINESWENKKKYNPSVTNDYIDSLINIGLKNGAIGGRLMGAGGGGHLLFYCNSNTEQIVRKEIEKAGAKVLNFGFDFKGLQTWEAEK